MTTSTDLVERVWLDSVEAAVYTGRHKVTIRRAAADGPLESVQARPGGRRRYRREWLDAWVIGRRGPS